MTAIIEAKDLRKTYVLRRGWAGYGRQELRAVDGVSFTISPGEQLGLVGESGCGKSSVGELLIRLLEPDQGSVHYRGTDLTALSQSALKSYRRDLQIVFQDPFASLNPRLTVGETLEEPLIVHAIAPTPHERRQKVGELLEMVGLPAASATRFPHEFSGGQRQRISLARALATNPKFIVADEPVSSLDVSIQAQVLSLIKSLQRDLGLAMLFISHDLGAVRYLCDRIAVMYLGRIIELAPAADLFSNPAHPYTRTLIGSVPSLRRRSRPGRGASPMDSDPPSPLSPPSGCRFRTRCSFALPQCADAPPPLVDVGPGHVAACIRRDLP